MHRPRREKVALFFVFGVGTFAAVASMVRLQTIYKYTLATDPFQQSILINVWSVIEMSVATCCASVSALKPIFSQTQRQRTSRALASSHSGAGGGRSGRGHGRSGARNWPPWGYGGGGDGADKFSSSLGDSQGTRFSLERVPPGRLRAGRQEDDDSAAVAPFPSTAPLEPVGGDRARGLQRLHTGRDSDRVAEAESMESSIESDGMIFFTPLTPPERTKGAADGTEEDERQGHHRHGMSSSGSMIIIQR